MELERLGIGMCPNYISDKPHIIKMICFCLKKLPIKQKHPVFLQGVFCLVKLDFFFNFSSFTNSVTQVVQFTTANFTRAN